MGRLGNSPENRRKVLKQQCCGAVPLKYFPLKIGALGERPLVLELFPHFLVGDYHMP
jgi:hypothetical protein